MGDATPLTPQAGGAGAVTNLNQPTPPQSGAGGQGGEAQPQSTATVDWEKIDLSTVPWDKIGDKVPIDKLPGAQKMQSSLRQQIAALQAQAQQAQADLVATRKQAESFAGLVAKQGPQYQQQVAAIQQESQVAQLQAQLAMYQRQEALKQMAQHYQVPEQVILDQPLDRPEQAYEAVINYYRTQAQTGGSSLQQQVADLQRQLAALSAAKSDPAANADRGAAAPSTNLQALYDEAAKALDGPKAEQIARQAETAGITLDLESAWRRR